MTYTAGSAVYVEPSGSEEYLRAHPLVALAQSVPTLSSTLQGDVATDAGVDQIPIADRVAVAPGDRVLYVFEVGLDQRTPGPCARCCRK
ncbi:hypothetical protein [Xanthomonas fragariae]|uniref:hypothetical protein n=1 Tax=Xanthomonas fragariae TaxID=48664 RepID=UPI0003271874|nr:hypothetical protein BER92_14590 [Xanthomonas fragariae]AOD19122.1 hypothetical protein BER93_14625 [Xanthomonas fragariae]ENZ95301.1 hypothetical protein O1K_09352 [Xanthomonas fragariae LMG 25863]